MDWLGRVAGELRETIAAHAWLGLIRPIVESAPDWALVGAPALVVLALILVLLRPRRNPPADKFAKAPRAATQTPPVSAQTDAAAVVPVVAARARPKAAAPSATEIAQQRDDDSDRIARIFISSAFLDMQAERDVLGRKTFPGLRATWRAKGVELYEVELRWGVDEEEIRQGQLLPVIMGAINNCNYFIAILGDRYGREWEESEIGPHLKESFPALADAAGLSLTEMEIVHAVLADRGQAKRALFFFRDPAWAAALGEAKRAELGIDTGAAQDKLVALKQRIKDGGATVIDYDNPDDLDAKAAAALSAMLAQDFQATEPPDAFRQTERLHGAYARERRGLHIGANSYVAALNDWVAGEDAQPMLVVGASGGGKSTLIANWLAAWRSDHPNDLVFEHYLGASPDSADPVLLMRRLWEHLNRATGETLDLPGGNAELMDLATGLAERLAQANAVVERKGGRILIALDGLDKLSREQNLRWLPIVPRVKLIASSLDGDAKTAALTRGWGKLEIALLGDEERRAFIAATLARWGKGDLAPARKQRILAHPLAGIPLFLKTVIDELRVSATEAVFNDRLGDYLSARDMPELFSRMLVRLEADFGAPLARQALSLIWASRAGLEEGEIIAITGATPLAWATLGNGLSDSLRDQAGRLAFSHDYLNQAVAARYLKSNEQKRLAHVALADRFEAREPDERQSEELPFQLRAAQAWERLEALLIDLDRFKLLRASGDGELLSYWLPLKAQGREPEALLCSAFAARAGDVARWTEADVNLAGWLCSFLDFAGAYGASRTRLQQQLTAASERLFGSAHPEVATALNNLAYLLEATNRHAEAEPLYKRALAIDEIRLGLDHPKVATALSNLAYLLQATNRHAEAEPLFRRALAIDEASFGPDHPKVATHLNNLAVLLYATNRGAEAEPLYRRVVTIFEHSFGPDHPDVATALSNLAVLLQATNRGAEAEPLYRRALAIDETSFGPDHPDVATALSNLAVLLQATNRHAEAEPLCRRVVTIFEQSFGPDHPDVATALSNLASLLQASNRHAEAEPLFRRALAIDEASFGPDHPKVATHLNNLAVLLYATNRGAEAEPLYRRVVTIFEHSFGPDHPKVATALNSLVALLQDTNRHAELLFGSDHPLTIAIAKKLAARVAELQAKGKR